MKHAFVSAPRPAASGLRRPATRAGLCTALIVLACVLSLSLSEAAQPLEPESVTPTNNWADFYSCHLTFSGVPAPAGTYVGAYDPQGTQCGGRNTTKAGYLAPVMPCYADDSSTPADEGASDGDLIHFQVNGAPAAATARKLNMAAVNSTTPIEWHSKDAWEIDLAASAQPQLKITSAAGQSNLSWQPAVVTAGSYEVWRGSQPYFNPTAGEGERIGTVPANASPLAWSDTTGAGNPDLNLSYRILSKNGAGTLVGASQEVGEFDFALE
jgi:hypothetical protein